MLLSCFTLNALAVVLVGCLDRGLLPVAEHCTCSAKQQRSSQECYFVAHVTTGVGQSTYHPHHFEHKQGAKAALGTEVSQAAICLHPSAANGPFVSM